jgi:hypothetical protein
VTLSYCKTRLGGRMYLVGNPRAYISVSRETTSSVIRDNCSMVLDMLRYQQHARSRNHDLIRRSTGRLPSDSADILSLGVRSSIDAEKDGKIASSWEVSRPPSSAVSGQPRRARSLKSADVDRPHTTSRTAPKENSGFACDPYIAEFYCRIRS